VSLPHKYLLLVFYAMMIQLIYEYAIRVPAKLSTTALDEFVKKLISKLYLTNCLSKYIFVRECKNLLFLIIYFIILLQHC